MKHLGDITKISGYDTPIVDIICGGSPCQDLSVAGKRAGLDGERSGLFMEQVRIVKEMREKNEEQQRDRRTDKYIRPRFMVWENVQGAFSSPGKRNGEDHRGEDFQAVLTEIARIAKSKCPVVPLPKDRRWPHSGCIMGIGDNGQPFSIAYRLHDAQFWGVPQRRKRISLVADFGGCAASDILFEKVSSVKQGLSRDIEQSEQAWERAAKDTEGGTRETSKTYDVRISSDGTKNWRAHCYETNICRALDTGGEDPDSNHGGVTVVQSYSIDQGAGKSSCSVLEEQSLTLATTHDGAPAVYNISPYESNAMKSSNPHSGIYEARTSRTLDLNGGNPNCNQGGSMIVQGADMYNQSLTGEKTMSVTGAAADPHHIPCVILENHPNDSRVKISDDGVVQTLSSRMGTGGGNVPMVMEQPITASKASFFMNANNDGKAETLVATDYKDPQLVAYGLDRASFNQGQNAKYNFSIEEEKIGAQVARDPGAVCNQSIVRRLTPLECERLQGFPDNWTNIGEWIDSKGKKHKDADSPRYKALGNSIALPFWQWMADRMVKVLREDGVQQPTMASLFDGISGFCLVFTRVKCKPIWSSEIEEFPIAVAKRHFGDDDAGVKGDYESSNNNKGK